jgi:hypothetical protein
VGPAGERNFEGEGRGAAGRLGPKSGARGGARRPRLGRKPDGPAGQRGAHDGKGEGGRGRLGRLASWAGREVGRLGRNGRRGGKREKKRFFLFLKSIFL